MVGRSDPVSRRGWMSRPIGRSWPGRLTSKWSDWPLPLRRTLSVMLEKLRSPRPSTVTISSPARSPAA